MFILYLAGVGKTVRVSEQKKTIFRGGRLGIKHTDFYSCLYY